MESLTWEEVKGYANDLFNIWIGHYEINWAHKAWNILEKTGLTRYETDLEKHKALIRLLTLATLYAEFCKLAFEESSCLYYYGWIDLLDLNKFRLAQLIGTNFLQESYDDEDSLARQALEELIENCRNEVSCALIEELGVDMLFVSMWLTVERDEEQEDDIDCDIEDIEEKQESSDQDEFEEYERKIKDDAWHILNVLTVDKLVAYEWISSGMDKVWM